MCSSDLPAVSMHAYPVSRQQLTKVAISTSYECMPTLHSSTSAALRAPPPGQFELVQTMAGSTDGVEGLAEVGGRERPAERRVSPMRAVT